MHKVPHRLAGIVMPNPDDDPGDYENFVATADILDAIEEFARSQYGVNELLCVKYHGRYYITTYYWMDNKRDAEFDAARNGFPFYADENNRPQKVGLLARAYRAIIA